MKRILITGASSGIGRQLAIDYAKNGDHVIACARSIEPLDSLKALYPDKIEYIKLDVTSQKNVNESFSLVKNIDLIILNAGTCEYVDISNFDSKLFERVFNVNFMGVIYCLEAILPNINKSGQVAIVGSQARQLPFTLSAAYGASKAAIHYLTKSLAVDFAESSFSFHSISPGFVKTPLTDKNEFPMPFLVSVERASKDIIAGLNSGKSEINFPKRLSWSLKFASYLPEFIQHKICVWMAKQAQ